jgi:hypothetical protein
MTNRSPKEIREAAGLSLIAAAVGAGCAEGTTRLFEASRDAVSAKSRARLDAYYSKLEASLDGAAAPRGAA